MCVVCYDDMLSKLNCPSGSFFMKNLGFGGLT